MKSETKTLLCYTTMVALTMAACRVTTYLEAFAPEEGTLNLVRLTDPANTPVIGNDQRATATVYYALTENIGYSSKYGITWNSNRKLDISPNGKHLAYISMINNQTNAMIRSTGAQGMSTQRTFRNVSSISWGKDNKLYFDNEAGNNSYICSVDAFHGSMMAQLTSGSVQDCDPVMSPDGKTVFFTRSGTGNYSSSIWSLNRSNGTLTSCARGFNPCLIKGNPNAFYCVRNSTEGRSEIWYVDFVKGQESLVVSDTEHSFTQPKLSPDGKWIVCTGNSMSNISQRQNLDIFVVRTDGTQLTQLTYHPETDCSPVWSADGKSIYFISSRADEKRRFSIWRMNFDLK